MRARGLVIAVLAVTACDPFARRPPSLEASLATLAGLDTARREHAVRAWKLDRATWEATVVEPYRALYADYARAFDAAVPGLVTQLAQRGAITTRPHHAGDPRLTLAQAHARWAVPVLYASRVAEVGSAPLDVVFVPGGTGWRAIVGLDELIRARVAGLDPACAPYLAVATTGPCGEIGWEIAEAALRGDRARLTHACALATTLCAR